MEFVSVLSDEKLIAKIDAALTSKELRKDGDWFVEEWQSAFSVERVTTTLFELYSLLQQRGKDGQFQVNPAKVKALFTGKQSLLEMALLQEIVVGAFEDEKVLVGGGHRTTAMVELLHRKLFVQSKSGSVSDAALIKAMKATNVVVTQKTFQSRKDLYAAILTDNGSRTKTPAETASVNALVKLGFNINDLANLRTALERGLVNVAEHAYRLYTGEIQAPDSDGVLHPLTSNSMAQLFKRLLNHITGTKTGLTLTVLKGDEEGNPIQVVNSDGQYEYESTGTVYNFSKALVTGLKTAYNIPENMRDAYTSSYPRFEFDIDTGYYVWEIPTRLDQVVNDLGYIVSTVLLEQDESGAYVRSGINVTRFSENDLIATVIDRFYAHLQDGESEYAEYFLPVRPKVVSKAKKIAAVKAK